jgi:replicative DNA helicase
VDYLQHPSLHVPGAKQEFERVTEISSALCDIGKANNVPIVALSQLSRPDKKYQAREPRMEDLRQSGQIEQDADLIALLYRPEEQDGDEGATRFTGLDKIILAKQRNGPAGEFIAVKFDGPMCVYKPRWKGMAA